MKPLPYIAIEGVGKTKEEVLDSLIAIEPLLVMMGYNKPNEKHNNWACDVERLTEMTHLLYDKDGGLTYNNHNGSYCFNFLRFKSTEINKLIKYMITNKFIK